MPASPPSAWPSANVDSRCGGTFSLQRCCFLPRNRYSRIGCHARRSPMSQSPRGVFTMHDELESVLRDVRLRWRLKLALRGLTWILGAAVVSLLFTSIGMERLGFTPQSIVVARVIVYVAMLAAAAVFLLLPLVRRVPDQRVALYLEESEPSLDAAVVSAVEQEDPRVVRATQSEALAKGVVSSAISRLRSIDRGRRVERGELQRGAAILGG